MSESNVLAVSGSVSALETKTEAAPEASHRDQLTSNDPTAASNFHEESAEIPGNEESATALESSESSAEYVVDQLAGVRDMIKQRVTLSKLQPEMWLPEHDETIDRFVGKGDTFPRLLIAYIDHISGLVLMDSIPYGPVTELVYFIRRKVSSPVSTDEDEPAVLTTESFTREVQYGIVTGRHIESLLRIMTGVYVPMFFRNTSWPDSIKNDFIAQLHKFMASLTDTRWKMDGKTVLYIPHEGTVVPADATTAKNKELIQRLETAMIHWTRQIKEVLSAQDALQTSENAGPLEEIEFWKNRCADLSGITTQLDKPGVKQISNILSLAKSSYVAPFLKLSGQIKEGSNQAQSNLKFLSVLKDPCHELAEAHPRDIAPMLPKILNLIRMIWVNSEFYKTRERLTGLLRKLSNEVIRRCCKRSILITFSVVMFSQA
jgi:dynein heavy chain